MITPRIVGGKLGLSPAWVLFALMAFGYLFGFVGVMLALSASAVFKVLVLDASTFSRANTRAQAARLLPRTRRSVRVHAFAPPGGSR